MEKKEFLSKNQKKLFLTFGTIIAVYIGMKYLLPLFVPFLFAYFIAWLLRPMVGFLHRKLKIPLVVGGSFGVLLLLLAISVILFSLGRILCNQVILFLRNLPIYEQYFTQQLKGFCQSGDKFLGLADGEMGTFMEDCMNSIVQFVQHEVIPKLTQQTIKVAVGMVGVIAIIFFTLVATIFIIKDMEEYQTGLKKSEFYPAVHKITSKLSETGIAYMKTQVIIMTIIAVINTVGFYLLKNPYALLVGVLVGLFDALPVLGSGLVLVPWSIAMLLQRKFLDAAVIMSIFLLCQLIREVLEPKLLGDRIGIKALYNMIAIYIGFQLFGIAGFFLGPLGLVIIKTVLVTYV